MRAKNAMSMFMLVLIGAIICSCGTKETINWPESVLNSLWIPEQSFDRHYSSHEGIYQITYKAKICYPPNQMIHEMEAFMKKRGWTRMIDDPLNPGDRLSYAISPDGMTWKAHPWIEYWRNQRGDVVYYQYAYALDNLPFESYVKELQKSCLLKGAIIFYPTIAFEKIKVGKPRIEG